MSTRKLSNISLAKYLAFLELCHCTLLRNNSGHDVYARADLLRPIVPQNHIDPVPERILKQGLRALGYSRSDFFDIMDGVRVVVRKGPKSFAIEVSKSKTAAQRKGS